MSIIPVASNNIKINLITGKTLTLREKCAVCEEKKNAMSIIPVASNNIKKSILLKHVETLTLRKVHCVCE